MKPLESRDWLNKTQWKFLPTSTRTDTQSQVMYTYSHKHTRASQLADCSKYAVMVEKKFER